MILKTQEQCEKDSRCILTLDAGGTNLVFSAMQGGRDLVSPLTLPCYPDDLERCLSQIEKGFLEIRKGLRTGAHAISFAFPGPANYPLGIIGDLPNLPAFRGGVALGPFLEEKFQVPVFINNDGNLFTLGETIFGFLPEVNRMIRAEKGMKVFSNLLGLTLGTGFGCGIVCGGQLLVGDNSNGGEIWLVRSKIFPDQCNDACIGRDKIRRHYADLAGIGLDGTPQPDILYRIAKGEEEGNQKAALQAFDIMGEVLGDAIANAITLVDGLVVIGGGLSGAHEFFMPAVLRELGGTIAHVDGKPVPRLPARVFFLHDRTSREEFIRGEVRTVRVPFTDRTVTYDAMPRIGIGISALGVNRATSLGAYAFALSRMDEMDEPCDP